METMDITTDDGKEKTCFVAYSLGNFFSSQNSSYASGCEESVILNLQFTKNGETGETTLTNASYTPLYLLDSGKDAVRLKEAEGLSEPVRQSIYALPIKVSFMLDQEENFNEKIISYVRKNSRNSILAKRKDDHKSKDRHHSGNGTRTISFRNN